MNKKVADQLTRNIAAFRDVSKSMRINIIMQKYAFKASPANSGKNISHQLLLYISIFGLYFTANIIEKIRYEIKFIHISNIVSPSQRTSSSIVKNIFMLLLVVSVLMDQLGKLLFSKPNCDAFESHSLLHLWLVQDHLKQ